MQLNKLLIALSTLASISILTSCGGGGSGSSSSGGGTSGDGSLNIQPVSTLGALDAKYNSMCVFSYANTDTTLVKTDGSGTGITIKTTTGQITNVTGLPQINISNGDACLPNFAQLVWYNTANPTTVNIYDPSTKQTTSADFSSTPSISGYNIQASSFMYDPTDAAIYANSNFKNDGYTGFSRFSLSTLPITSYFNLPNTDYNRQVTTPVLYGFWGIDGNMLQMYPASGSQPALLVNVSEVGHGNPEQQRVLPITDANGQAISNMSATWDMAFTNTGIMVSAGMLQPILYSCQASSSPQSFKCNKSYTTPDFTAKYRIMRLLGASSSKLYFMGMDMTKATVNIFSMNL